VAVRIARGDTSTGNGQRIAIASRYKGATFAVINLDTTSSIDGKIKGCDDETINCFDL
jgi:hypothetical protein